MTSSDRLPNFEKGGGLLPVVTQDVTTGTVLMLAWMNEESFRETVSTSQAVYFSRSRNRLWRKGETSGHVQRVVSIHVDCDGDAILLKVHQVGAACHDGYQSCFYRTIDADGGWNVSQRRLVDPTEVRNPTYES